MIFQRIIRLSYVIIHMINGFLNHAKQMLRKKVLISFQIPRNVHWIVIAFTIEVTSQFAAMRLGIMRYCRLWLRLHMLCKIISLQELFEILLWSNILENYALLSER